MNAATLLHELEERGVQFEAKDGRLRYRAPAGVLTPELLATLRSQKNELLDLLAPVAPPDPRDARDLVAAWRGAVRELSDLAGYPKLSFKPGYSVSGGAAGWGTFISRASIPDLRRVVTALRELLASVPRPGVPE